VRAQLQVVGQRITPQTIPSLAVFEFPGAGQLQLHRQPLDEDAEARGVAHQAEIAK